MNSNRSITISNKESQIIDFVTVTTPLNQYLSIKYWDNVSDSIKNIAFVELSGYGTLVSFMCLDSPELREYLTKECNTAGNIARFCQVQNLPLLHDQTWRKLNRYMTYEEFNGTKSKAR